MSEGSPANKRSRVALYARYSTDRQDARSIDDQLRRCRAYAASNGMDAVAEYTDAAVSGATLDRADLKRLLADVTHFGEDRFEALLVDDLSRLSRDLGDTWTIVFGDLAHSGVRVVDVTTGIASDSSGARLAFGASALVNDYFLQLVRSETHRGLEGRAMQGFWTGGRVYGYRTRKEENPSDPDHPRSLLIIHQDEAEVVCRVFRLYAEGVGFKSIASLLNGEGKPAPYDALRPKPRGRGWSSSTIRALLRNERYIGHFVWNRRKWVRLPRRKGRKCLERPPNEWKVFDRPDLAIVNRELWEKVQGRLKDRESQTRAAQRPGRPGRPPGSGRFAYLLSGILRCGACGANMGVVGVKTKGEYRYATFGCSARHTKGDAICKNSLTVSERKASGAIVGALQDTLIESGLLPRFVERFNQRILRARQGDTDKDFNGLQREILTAELRVRNVTEAIAKAGWSEALNAQLVAEETRLRSLMDQHRGLLQRLNVPVPLIPQNHVESLVRNLLGTMDADPRSGRELLAKHVGPITLTPKINGSSRWYEASGAFDLSVVLKSDRVLENSSCGGWI